MLTEEEVEICMNAHGGWITSLWGILCVDAIPTASFEEKKAAFFWLLEKLLREGKVEFCHPEDPWDTYGMVWDVSVEEKIKYLRSKWPASAEEELDSDLNLYFYEIPAISWLGEDGKWYSS